MANETLQSKDFRLTKNGNATFGTPGQILPEVNKWLESKQVRLISVESLFQNGCSGVGIVNDFAGVRVWYSQTSLD